MLLLRFDRLPRIPTQQSRRTSGVGLTSRLAGMSLLEVAEASSPGPGKVDLEPRSRLSPFPQAAAFTGGAISEGEEEEVGGMGGCVGWARGARGVILRP